MEKSDPGRYFQRVKGICQDFDLSNQKDGVARSLSLESILEVLDMRVWTGSSWSEGRGGIW